MSSRAISVGDAADRDVHVVSPVAMARISDPMAHFPGQEFMAFLGLLTACHIQEIPNMIRPTIPTSSPWPRARPHRISLPTRF